MLQPRSVTLVQLVCAALGIPAAIAGSYSAYQTYFSNEAVCQRLRTAVVATMERKLPLDAKQALLRKDVADFDKNCGDGDPDARTVFQTAMQERPPAPKARMQLPVWGEPQLDAANDPGKSQSLLPARACVRVLATQPGGNRLWAQVAPASCNGWVALGRREAGAWVANFLGFAISETALPPAGTILTAQRQLPVWSEPQLTAANDQTKLQNMLPARGCVRVLSTRPGISRLWAEVAPAACS